MENADKRHSVRPAPGSPSSRPISTPRNDGYAKLSGLGVATRFDPEGRAIGRGGAQAVYVRDLRSK